MATTQTRTALPARAGRGVFARVLVGIDGSSQALEAARQAAILEDVEGQLTLLSAWNVAPPILTPAANHPYAFDEKIEKGQSEKALCAARDSIAAYTAARGVLVRGAPVAELLAEIERDEDTLVAVGNSGARRLLGIVEGAVATEMIHRAPCSVLVARPAEGAFPRRIVVGVDGSVESAAAYAAAAYLAARFDGELHAVVAWGGDVVDERLVATITAGVYDDRREGPAEALTAAAETADLVVVGSRGLHGVRALGSVSERVAHAATCSALVVRAPIWQRVAEELGRKGLNP